MPQAMPHQIEGALFLSNRFGALLADEQRVGKTGAAVIAADYTFAKTILIVTKSSARSNWARDVASWGFRRKIQVIYSGKDRVDSDAQVVIVGWGMIYGFTLFHALFGRQWDLLILDEGHEAKSPDAKRTQAVYGGIGKNGLTVMASYTWVLTGTPIPNTPIDLFPMLKALYPACLDADPAKGWPDVSNYDAFLRRYCVTVRKKLNWQFITIPIKGQNETELRDRMDGFWLRRTQQDVGIGKPIYSMFYLHADKLSRTVKNTLSLTRPDTQEILDAAEHGLQLSDDDYYTAELRHIVGVIKAHAIVEAAREEFESGLDKIVIMAWHSDVIDIIREGLQSYGVAGIDGRTPPKKRAAQEQAFQTDPDIRVFVGQIQAAGEAIDLSASALLWFAELSFTPKDMDQAAKRITNHTQKRQALVRVCALEGTIDEGLCEVVTRKFNSIKTIQERVDV